MSTKDDVSSIADASRPNAGRIYDYLLGGNHNFEIDRQAAEQMLAALPEASMWARLIRWFLGEAVRRLLDEGFTKFIDFASGLPTVDHIHQIAPEIVKVIYSDIDPLTVAYAKEIIKDNPNAVYLECDIAEPEKLLTTGITEKMFGEDKKVAIGFNGVSYFLSDEQIAHALKVLYEWADKGTKLFISAGDPNMEENPTVTKMYQFYAQVGQPLFTRSLDKLIDLMGDWKPIDPGFLPLEDWLNVQPKGIEEAKKLIGGSLKGVFAVKS